MNKAILLAGGRGTRLSPLTDELPKPLMPLLDKSIIECNLLYLSKLGITDAVISVAYRADDIKNKLGGKYADINLHYCEEQVPLGTAGGIKFAKKLLNIENDDSFLVMSADCIFDFNLLDAYRFHAEAEADATVITTRCDDPLEFGIVLSDSNGRIYSFNEKPSWSQVMSDEVNTGIYILKSDVTDMIPYGEYDFSRNLFPSMLAAEKKLFSFRSDGYWCDIGSIENYLKCSFDALSGKIKSIGKMKENPRSEYESRGIELTEPYYIASTATIGDSCRIGPNTIVGDNCIVDENSSITGSILHSNCKVGKSCDIAGTIIASGAIIGNTTRIESGSVISSNVVIDERSAIENYSIITQNTSRSPKHTEVKTFIADKFILGSTSNIDYENTFKMAYSISEACGKYEKIGLMSCGGVCDAYAKIFCSAVEFDGRQLYDFGIGFDEVSRLTAVEFSIDCFVFIEKDKDNVYCKIYNKNGNSPSRDFERRLEYELKKFDSPSVKKNRKSPIVIENAASLYNNKLLELLDVENLKNHSVAFSYESDDGENFAFEMLKKAYVSLGGRIISVKEAEDNARPVIIFTESKDIIFAQSNYSIDKYHIAALLFENEYKKKHFSFALPYQSPKIYVEIIGEDKILSRFPYHSASRINIPREAMKNSVWLNDDILLAAKMIGYMVRSNINISEAYMTGRRFDFSVKTLEVDSNVKKMDIIRYFRSKTENKAVRDHYEGITLRYPNGTVTLIPEKRNAFKIITETLSTEASKEIAENLKNEIGQI